MTWHLTNQTTNSGKQLFRCDGCGALDPAPTKNHEHEPLQRVCQGCGALYSLHLHTVCPVCFLWPGVTP
jgi:hypothetical protein